MATAEPEQGMQLEILGNLRCETDGFLIHVQGNGSNIEIAIETENKVIRLSRLARYFRVNETIISNIECNLLASKLDVRVLLGGVEVLHFGQSANPGVLTKLFNRDSVRFRLGPLMNELVKQRRKAFHTSKLDKSARLSD